MVVATALLTGCRSHGQSASPDGRDFPHVTDSIDRHAPSVADISNLSFSGTEAGTVTLTSGAWQGASLDRRGSLGCS